MAIRDSLLVGEPSSDDYIKADEFIRWAVVRGGMSDKRRDLLTEFRRVIARTYQAERLMGQMNVWPAKVRR
jgi:hypothetical protein